MVKGWISNFCFDVIWVGSVMTVGAVDYEFVS